MALKEGSAAPDFKGVDHTGKTVALSDFRGKILVLWFFPKADTPGCTAEGECFRDLSAEYEKRNAAILGCSFDTQEDNAKFVAKYHFTFPILCDTSREIGLAYGACDDVKASVARRCAAVIDPAGVVTHYFDKVDARTFPTEMLKALPTPSL